MNTNAIATATTEGLARSPVKVICLGEILLDCLANELGKSLETVSSWTSYPGGAPANVACALAKLGTPAAFIGCVGEDNSGRELVELLDSVGVKTTGIQYHADAPTREVYVLRSHSGDRTFAGFGERPRVDERRKRGVQAFEETSKDSPLGTREFGERQPDEFADAFLQADKLPPELFLEAEFLVLGTLELAYPQTREAIFRALKLAEEYHLKVVLDINWRPMFWRDPSEALPIIEKLWEYVDFLKLAEEEAQWLFNTADAGTISYHLGSVEGVLVSNGDANVSYCINDIEGIVTPFSVKVEDTTGAGDAFLAGFIHQLCQIKMDSLDDARVVKEIVTYACAVGGLTTTQPGAIAAQPSRAEVEAFLEERSKLV
ncbi:MAG: carbohydrate kinase [Pleurocapsa sp.]